MNERICIIGQSGGPTAAINATLAGVIKAAKQAGYQKIYGMLNGIEGFISDHIIDLMAISDEQSLDMLIHTPAMYLGSCRFKINSADTNLKDLIFNKLNQLNVTDFFYIGGNDSMDTVQQLSEHAAAIGSAILFIGIPKTIDNDLAHTYYTPGYPSACQYVATTLLEISRDTCIYPEPSVTIVELMGRDAGWLTASAALVNENNRQIIDLIYLPEIPFDIDDFIVRVKNQLKIKKHLIVAVSEGIKDRQNEYIAVSAGYQIDPFGNCSRSGCAARLKEWLEPEINCKIRSIELNILQRCSGHLANEVDISNAIRFGETAVEFAMAGETGIFVGSTYSKLDGLKFKNVIISEVSNKVKPFPLEWIDQDTNQIRRNYIDYVMPIISRDCDLPLPKYIINTLN